MLLGLSACRAVTWRVPRLRLRSLMVGVRKKLIAAGVADSLAHQTGELFAKGARSEKNISLATEVSQACNSATILVDLLSKNPSKWKRNSDSNALFTTKSLYHQFNAAAQDLNSAIKALNGG